MKEHEGEDTPSGIEAEDMVTLVIDLQDGFADDTVVLHVNGEKLVRRAHISTKLLLGLAESFRTEIPIGPVTVDIDIQTKDVTKTILLKVYAPTYLGISVANGEVEYIVADEPFGYG